MVDFGVNPAYKPSSVGGKNKERKGIHGKKNEGNIKKKKGRKMM